MQMQKQIKQIYKRSKTQSSKWRPTSKYSSKEEKQMGPNRFGI